MNAVEGTGLRNELSPLRDEAGTETVRRLPSAANGRSGYGVVQLF